MDDDQATLLGEALNLLREAAPSVEKAGSHGTAERIRRLLETQAVRRLWPLTQAATDREIVAEALIEAADGLDDMVDHSDWLEEGPAVRKAFRLRELAAAIDPVNQGEQDA